MYDLNADSYPDLVEATTVYVVSERGRQTLGTNGVSDGQFMSRYRGNNKSGT